MASREPIRPGHRFSATFAPAPPEWPECPPSRAVGNRGPAGAVSRLGRERIGPDRERMSQNARCTGTLRASATGGVPGDDGPNWRTADQYAAAVTINTANPPRYVRGHRRRSQRGRAPLRSGRRRRGRALGRGSESGPRRAPQPPAHPTPPPTGARRSVIAAASAQLAWTRSHGPRSRGAPSCSVRNGESDDDRLLERGRRVGGARPGRAGRSGRESRPRPDRGARGIGRADCGSCLGPSDRRRYRVLRDRCSDLEREYSFGFVRQLFEPLC